MTAQDWRISRIRGFSLGHDWAAVAPGCPADRHPTRWCKCKVHRTRADAEAYVAEQETRAA